MDRTLEATFAVETHDISIDAGWQKVFFAHTSHAESNMLRLAPVAMGLIFRMCYDFVFGRPGEQH